MSIRSALLAVSVFGSAPLVAQVPAGPAVGARVRVLLTTDTASTADGPRIGRLVARGDSMLLLDRGRRRGIDTIPQSEIRRVDVAIGRRSIGTNVLRGTWIGGAILGGAGLITGAVLHDGYACSDGGFCVTAGAGALVGGVLGMGTGALIGLMFGPTTRWQKGETPPRVMIAPGADGSMKLGLSISP